MRLSYANSTENILKALDAHGRVPGEAQGGVSLGGPQANREGSGALGRHRGR